MAAQFEITPTCEISGLPLPIIPNRPGERLRAISLSDRHDRHHHFHPESDPRLQTLAGKAVRHSRVQVVDRRLHDNYHWLLGGSELPDSTDKALETTVLTVAGVVPQRGLNLSRYGEYSEEPISRKYYDQLTSGPKITIESGFHVSNFFASHAAEQGIEEYMNETLIEEFLDKQVNKNRKSELAKWMLSGALELSLDDVNRRYSFLRAEGYMGEKPPTFYSMAWHYLRLNKKSIANFSRLMDTRLRQTVELA